MISASAPSPVQVTPSSQAKPRLGFLGIGWIGYQRMLSILDSGAAELAAVADPDDSLVSKALGCFPGAVGAASLEDLLSLDLDGIVIATPSAYHSEQTIAALEHGLAVFCQKPLSRNPEELRSVIRAARCADRLLGVDLSYRYTEALQQIRTLIQDGTLGHIYSVDLVFHNAYGPQKSWFYDPKQSGGGCMMDLGIHLVDAATWMLPPSAVKDVRSRLYHRGEPLTDRSKACEDYAAAMISLANGCVLNLACSWHLHAGQDAVIQMHFHGTNGGATMTNINGSFTDFLAEHYTGTKRTRLCSPPDAWGGRAAVSWAKQLGISRSYDLADESVMIQVADTLEAIYRASN